MENLTLLKTNNNDRIKILSKLGYSINEEGYVLNSSKKEVICKYSKERVPDLDDDDAEDKFTYYAIRLIAAIVVAVIAALIVDFVTEGAVDFAFAFFVLVAFAVIEWFVRAKQIGES